MKIITSLLTLLLVPTTFFSQSNTIVLNSEGKDLKEIIPEKWNILKSERGDLNNDGIQDLVFVIQDTKLSNIKKNPSAIGVNTIDSNPRILGIYFGTKNGVFIKEIQSDNFIALKDDPTMDEPLDILEISKKGILKVGFRFWYSAGSREVTNYTYKFRFQNDEFALIGYDSSVVNRFSAKYIDHSVNFLTNKMKVSEGNYSKKNTETIKWEKIKSKKIINLNSFHSPLEWTTDNL